MVADISSRQLVCRLEEIDDGTARGFEFGEEGVELRLLIVRQGIEIYAYRNSCPHTGVTLEWLPDQFLDNSAEYIQCSVHGAVFRIEDGLCVRGPCAGDALTMIPAHLQDGQIICELPQTPLAAL